MKLDLSLTLDTDEYLDSFESIQYAKKILSLYNEKHKDKYLYDSTAIDFATDYPVISNVLDFITQTRDYDYDELNFYANMAYRLKGHTDSVEIILNILNCDYDLILENHALSLEFKNIEVSDIYLAELAVMKLCKDLLFFYDYRVQIDRISTIYKLTGNLDSMITNYSIINIADSTVISSEDRQLTF